MSAYALPPRESPAHGEPPAPAADATPATVVILGADAVLAALPATAVQLFQACLAAGYQSAVPATWGDELVAEAYLDELERRGGRPVVCCSCPISAARLTAAGGELSHALLPLLAPPAAAARYIRRKAGSTPLHVTYVGACPMTGETSIDVQLTPQDFLTMLDGLGIRVEEQPTTFDGVLPPDRRRHLSLPGGIPSAGALAARGVAHRLMEIAGADYATELADQLMGGEALLLDVAPWLGCACSGAVEGMAPSNARAVVMALEPPRSPHPVVDPSVPVDVHVPLPPRPEQPPEPQLPGCAACDADDSGRRRPATTPTAGFVSPRRPTPPGGRFAISAARRTPVGVARQWAGAFPKARAEDGRLLPRAYVARRHSFPVLTPIPPIPPAPTMPTAGGPVGSRPPAALEAAGMGEMGVGVATATPPDGIEFARFVADLAEVVTHHVTPHEGWRVRLDQAMAHWHELGYDVGVLQRARVLPVAPDVNGLLDTFAGAVEHLRRLEALAVAVRPSLRGAPIFRDPRNVAAAESLVDGLLAGSPDADR
jgi:hypothetical protein